MVALGTRGSFRICFGTHKFWAMSLFPLVCSLSLKAVTSGAKAGRSQGRSHLLSETSDHAPVIGDSTLRLNIIVFGSTGRTGRAVIAKLLADGHNVTAFTRDASKLAAAPRFIIVQGDAMQPADVARAVPGHDAAVVTLGNSQNPFALLLGARRTTPPNICEVGTRNIIAAIDPTSPARLIVVAAFGIGDTRDKLPFVAKLFYHSVLREQMADKERQEAALKSSYLDYVLVQPVALTDKPAAGTWLASASGATRKQYVSRADVAAFIAEEIGARRYMRQTVTLSG